MQYVECDHRRLRMNENIRSVLLQECELIGYDADDDGIHEMLRDAANVCSTFVDPHRHWDDYRYTVEICDMFIGYIDEYATGDMAGDLGYEFDINSVCEMCPVEVKTIGYIPKEVD